MPVSPNPLYEFSTYIPMASALLGAFIGGTISFLNLKRQFKEQRKRDIAQERKSERIALNSVMIEVEYNCIQLLNAKKHLEMHQIDFHGTAELLIKKDKWEKHSDTIEFIEQLDDDGAGSLLFNLQYFYYFVGAVLGTKRIDLKGLDNALNMGIDAKRQMKELLKELSPK